MTKKINLKNEMSELIELGYDMRLSEKLGKGCYYILALGVIEPHEHCGWCD